MRLPVRNLYSGCWTGSGMDGVESRPVMGEYLLYYRKGVAGGIDDGRLLAKPVPAAGVYTPGRTLVSGPMTGSKRCF